MCLRAGDVNRGSRTAGTTGDFPAHASDRAYPAKGGDPLTFRHSGGMSEGRLDLGAQPSPGRRLWRSCYQRTPICCDLRDAATAFSSCLDRKSTRLNSSHLVISYAVFCLKKKKKRY